MSGGRTQRAPAREHDEPAPGAAAQPPATAPRAAPTGSVETPLRWRGSIYATFAGFLRSMVRDAAVVHEVTEYLIAHESFRSEGRVIERADWERRMQERSNQATQGAGFIQTFDVGSIAYIEQHTGVSFMQLRAREAAQVNTMFAQHDMRLARHPVPDHPAPAEIHGPETGVVGTRADYRMQLMLGPNDTGDDPLEASRQIERGEFRWEVFGVAGGIPARRGRTVTAADGHADALGRIDNQLSRDAVRASEEYDDASREGRRTDQLVAAGNLLLTPTSAAVRYGEYALTRVFEWMVGDVADRTIPFREAGPFVIRCTAQPRTIEERPSRRPSIAIKTVTIREMRAEAQRNFAEQNDQLAMVEAERDLARASGQSAELARLERRVDETRRRLQALPADAIGVEVERLTAAVAEHERPLAELRASLERARAAHADGEMLVLRARIAHVEETVDALREQLTEVRRQRGLAGARHTLLGEHTFRPRAQIIDQTSGDHLDLLWEMSVPAAQGAVFHCQLSDVTTSTGRLHHATGRDAESAVFGAIRDFARMNTYGRGRLFVRLPPESGVPEQRRQADFENAPGSTVLLRERLQDLATVATAIASVVPGVGTVAMLAGAASASIGISDRLNNGTFRLDAETTTDLLTVLSAAATGASVIGRLRVVPFRQGMLALAPAGVAVRALGVATTAMDHAQTIITTVGLMQEYRRIQQEEEAGRMTPTAARTARLRLLTQHVQAMHGVITGGGHAEEPTGTVPRIADPPAHGAAPNGAAPRTHAGEAPAHGAAEPHVPTGEAAPMHGPPPLGAHEENPERPPHRDAIRPPPPPAGEPEGEPVQPPPPAHDPVPPPPPQRDPRTASTIPPTAPPPPLDAAEAARIRQAQIQVSATLTEAPNTQIVPDRTSPLRRNQVRVSVFERHVRALGIVRADDRGRRMLGRLERRGREIHHEPGGSYAVPGGHINVDPDQRHHPASLAFVIAHEADHVARERARPRPEDHPSYERFERAYMLHEAFAQAAAFDLLARRHLEAGGRAEDLAAMREYGAPEYFNAFLRTWNAYWTSNPHGNERSAWMRSRQAGIRELQRAFPQFPVSGSGESYATRARRAWERGRSRRMPTQSTVAGGGPAATAAGARSTPPSSGGERTPGDPPAHAAPSRPSSPPAAAEPAAAPTLGTPLTRAQARAAAAAEERERVRAYRTARIDEYNNRIAENVRQNAELGRRVREIRSELVRATRSLRLVPSDHEYRRIANEHADDNVRRHFSELLHELDGDANHDGLRETIAANNRDTERQRENIRSTPMPSAVEDLYVILRDVVGRRPEAEAVRAAGVTAGVDFMGNPPGPNNDITAEHIHALVAVVYTPGFASIESRRAQLAIINHRDNLVALVRSVNSQRSDRRWVTSASWMTFPDEPVARARLVNGAAELARRETAFEQRLPGMIQEALAAQEAGIAWPGPGDH